MHSGAQDNGQIEADQPVYHQPAPGLDYTIQARRDQPSAVYNPHGLMSHITAPPQSQPPSQQQQQTQPQPPNNIQQRPNSAQNSVQYGYEPTPSPIQ